MSKLIHWAGMTILCLLTSYGHAQAGRVIAATGEAYLFSQNNQSQTLQRQMTISEGDTLITGIDSEAHIRLSDNSILALRANTQLRILAYYTQQNQQPETLILELLSGGYRTITGASNESRRTLYQIKASNVNLFTQGAHYELALVKGDLFVGLYAGKLDIANAQNKLELGMTSASRYRFAHLITATNQLIGLVRTPAQLTQPLSQIIKTEALVDTDIPIEPISTTNEEDEEMLRITNNWGHNIDIAKPARKNPGVVKPVIQLIKNLSQTTENAITELN